MCLKCYVVAFKSLDTYLKYADFVNIAKHFHPQNANVQTFYVLLVSKVFKNIAKQSHRLPQMKNWHKYDPLNAI